MKIKDQDWPILTAIFIVFCFWVWIAVLLNVR